MPKGIKGFPPGQSGNPSGRPAGAKNKTTLLKEERRVMFDEVVSEEWLNIVKKLKPEYIADQFMGKAADKLVVSAEIKTSALTPEQIAKINEIAFGSNE